MRLIDHHRRCRRPWTASELFEAELAGLAMKPQSLGEELAERLLSLGGEKLAGAVAAGASESWT